jgi:hypothetical protein
MILGIRLWKVTVDLIDVENRMWPLFPQFLFAYYNNWALSCLYMYEMV